MRGAREPEEGRWDLRDLLLMVVLGVVFGFLYWALVQAWNGLAVLMGPAGDLAQHVLLGGWLLVAPIVVSVVRRPGSGVAAEVVASLVEVVFLGSPVGPVLVVSAVLQGLGSEAAFALTRYRSWSWPTYALSGVLGATSVFFFSALRFGWYGQDLFWVRLAVQAASGLVLGGLLAKVLVDSLVRTGVVDNFAIGRARPLGPGEQRGEGQDEGLGEGLGEGQDEGQDEEHGRRVR